MNRIIIAMCLGVCLGMGCSGAFGYQLSEVGETCIRTCTDVCETNCVTVCTR